MVCIKTHHQRYLSTGEAINPNIYIEITRSVNGRLKCYFLEYTPKDEIKLLKLWLRVINLFLFRGPVMTLS